MANPSAEKCTRFHFRQTITVLTSLNPGNQGWLQIMIMPTMQKSRTGS
jgi:hypothetical protein